VKFTDAGSVTLRAERIGEREFRFEVIDTGPGIAPEAQAAVFDAFQQASAGIGRGGTGLGLAICRQYAELMGGKLAVESTPGSGSRFRLTLPLRVAEGFEDVSAGDAQRRLVAGIGSRGLRALVVDDVAENRAVLAEILVAAGCEVELALSGEAALTQLEMELPDVAFIDIMMPGMDGLELAGRILERLGQGAVRLIATTASAFAHQQQHYLAAGFDDVMAKPIRCERVYECLADVLGGERESSNLEEQAADRAMIQTLRPDLRARLATAAELCSITDVKRCMVEIERSGAVPAALVRLLKRLVRTYDLPAVQRLAAAAESVETTAGVGS
jgi:CheY-like chemotaxis protein